MNLPLTDVEVRILGSLLEKEVTTPDNYPLSMSALIAACNQSSNREPVMQLDEATLTPAIASLRRASLLRAIQPAGSRVTKYQHLLTDALSLDARERAVLGVLALRGAQTAGELHARTARLAEFPDMAAIDTTLEVLAARNDVPLVMRLPRRPGQKEVRWAHLLSGEPVVAADGSESAAAAATPAPVPNDRFEALEMEVKSLRDEIALLRAQFEKFKSQF